MSGLPMRTKRCIDLAAAVILAAACMPVMALIAVLVVATDRGPALYWSDRIGRSGRVFSMPKFRTMKLGTPQVATDKLENPASRLTRIGGVLRKLSLDELPQLWSVIKGDMSLVGPRPALHNQHELIAARRAHAIDSIRPGVTGWAQVNGRDSLSDAEKLSLDREYLERASLGLDVKILAMTVFAVLRRDGISH